MDDKLRQVVARVEVSALSEAEKEEIYRTIAAGLQSTVWPLLLKYMPKDQLEDLASNPSKVTIESYGKLIEDTIKDGQAIKEIEILMSSIVDEVDKALTEQGMRPAPQM